MNGKLRKIFCAFGDQAHKKCSRTGDCPEKASPLSRACGCRRYRVCCVRGDRKLCARMAQLGVLPGSEIEVVCADQDRNCLIRVMGSTVTLDPLSADNILVIND
ncbi:MAG: hypothetical protein Kow0089_03330 [Desulfobulbaceae bacterium]